MQRITGYYIDWVRGPEADAVAPEVIEANIAHAKAKCERLRNLLLGATRRSWHIICPHEHEKIVAAGYQNGSVTSSEIIDFWCTVGAVPSDVLIVGRDENEMSGGMIREYQWAVAAKNIVWWLPDGMDSDEIKDEAALIESELEQKWLRGLLPPLTT